MKNPDDLEIHPPKRLKRPLRRRILGLLFALLLLLGLLLSLAPSLLSTRFGSRIMLGMVNRILPGTIQIEALSLSWFGRQSAVGMRLGDASGDLAIRIEEFTAEWSLWDALLGRGYPRGKTRLRKLEVDINLVGDDSSSTRDARATESGPALDLAQTILPADMLPADLLVDFELSDAEITIHQAGKRDVVIAVFAATLARRSTEDGLYFHLSGESRQGEMSGNFSGSGELQGVFSAEPMRSSDRPHVKIEFFASDLPADGLDAMLGQGGLLAAALGDQVDLKLTVNGSNRLQDFEASMDSPYLHFDSSGQIEAGTFTLSRPANLSGSLSPELFAHLIPRSARSEGLHLDRPLDFKITVESLSSSITGFDPSSVALKAQIESLNHVGLTYDGKLGQLDLTNLLATLSTDSLSGSIDFGLELGLAQGARSTSVKLTGKARELFDQQSRLPAERLQLDAQASIEGMPTALIDRLLDQGGLLSELFGPSIDLVASSSSTGFAQGMVSIGLESERLSIADLELRFDQGLTLNKPAVARGILTAELWQQVIGADHAIRLGADLPVDITLQSFSMPRPPSGQGWLQPATTKIELILATGNMQLSQVPQLGNLIAENLELRLSGESLAKLALTCSVRLSQADATGPLHELAGTVPLRISLAAVSGITPDFRLGATAITLVIDHQRVEFRAKLQLAEDLRSLELIDTASMKFNLSSELLASFDITRPEWITGADSLPLSLTLSQLVLPLQGDIVSGIQFGGAISFPEGVLLRSTSLEQLAASFTFSGADGSASIHVETRATVEGQDQTGLLTVDARLGRLLQAGNLALGDASIDASLRIDALSSALIARLAGLDPSSSVQAELSLTATVNSENLARSLQMEISANIAGQPEASEHKHLTVNIELIDLLDTDGRLDTDHLMAKVKAELHAIPVALLDDWTDSDGLLLSLLGQQLDLSATSSLQRKAGPLMVELEASHARASLDGSIADMVLRLNKPLSAELTTSRELGRKLLARLNPLLSGISGTDSIKLQIQPDGFAVPLADFALSKVMVPEMRIDIGQVTIENNELLQGLLTLAKRRSTNSTTAWFTPIVVAIESGRVRFLRRLDIRFDRSLHVATWGSADLSTGNYQQTLALTQDSLARYFDLDSLDPNDMFEIPIQGSVGLPRIDFVSAAMDMGRLQAEERAMSSILKKLDKLPAFARNLIQGQAREATKRFSRALGNRNRGKAPPPSQIPFPWQ